MPCFAQISMTRSKCLNPDSLRTKGFMSSSDRVRAGDMIDAMVFLTFEMTIVERNADAVQSETLEELGILVLEEIFQELHPA